MLQHVPNILTALRLAALVPYVALFFIGGTAAAWAIFGIFVVASLTDFLDGYLARKLGVSSEIGRFLDPIADKILVLVSLFLLAAQDMVIGWHLVAVLVILTREILVSGLREFLGSRAVVHVSQLAKHKTTWQLIAISLLLLAPVWNYEGYVELGGLAALWLATFLTALTGYQYFAQNMRYFNE